MEQRNDRLGCLWGGVVEGMMTFRMQDVEIE